MRNRLVYLIGIFEHYLPLKYVLFLQYTVAIFSFGASKVVEGFEAKRLNVAESISDSK